MSDEDRQESSDDVQTSSEVDNAAHATSPATKSGGLGGKTSPAEQVARMAMEALPEALSVILSVMRKPGRNAQNQLQAALKVVDLAERYQASHRPESDGRSYVLDRGEAAEVIRKRLGLR